MISNVMTLSGKSTNLARRVFDPIGRNIDCECDRDEEVKQDFTLACDPVVYVHQTLLGLCLDARLSKSSRGKKMVTFQRRKTRPVSLKRQRTYHFGSLHRFSSN